MAPRSPSLHKTVSSSSHRTLQTIPQSSSPHTDILPPEGQGTGVGLDESERTGLYNRSQATIQDPLSEQHEGQLSGRTCRSAAPPEHFPSMPSDPQPFDLSELQQGRAHNQVRGYLDGAGQARANLQSTLDDENTSKRDVGSGKDSREPSVRDNDEGIFRPGVRLNNLKASRMLFVLTLAHPNLTHLMTRFPT